LLDPSLGKDIGQLLPENAREHIINQSLRAKLLAGAESDWRWAHQSGHSLIFEHQQEFPAALTPYSDAPPILFSLGDVSCLSLPQVAVVGSRRPTNYGKKHAYEFSQSLVDHGLAVTSGLALGVDTIAHEGALSQKGKTIAVLAHGLDQIYPASNRRLAHQIVQQEGLLLSEFPIGTNPRKQYFPRRNRIMSGLSLGVLVVEATLRSGSLITARLASEQGKEVFAIPGSIQSVFSKGCHELIRQGATLVESTKDLLCTLSPLMAQELQSFSIEHGGDTESPDPKLVALDGLSLAQRQIVQALEHTPITIDELVNRTQLLPKILLTELMVLELQSLVSTVPGGYQLG